MIDVAQFTKKKEGELFNEFVATIHGAAVLDYVTIFCAQEAVDMLEDRCPELYTGRVRGLCKRIVGTDARQLQIAVDMVLAHEADHAWMFDLGNAVYATVRPSLDRLHVAVANALGKCKEVRDINVFAWLIVANSVASEAKLYVERRQRLFQNNTVNIRGKGRQSASFVISGLSPSGLKHRLALLCETVISRDAIDRSGVQDDPVVITGCKAVINTLATAQTWHDARVKADRLNGIPVTE